MKKKALWITETAVMLALLIAMQALTKPMGQLVTGSAVNAVLAVTVLMRGLSSGLTVALISPVFAYLFGIAPNLVTVPVITGTCQLPQQELCRHGANLCRCGPRLPQQQPPLC